MKNIWVKKRVKDNGENVSYWERQIVFFRKYIF